MLLETDSCKTFLSEELGRRIRANPRYSQRAFARQTGLSPGELSEVLRGKRALSLKSVLKVIRALGLNSAEAKHLMYLAQVEKTKAFADEVSLPETDPVPPKQQLSLDMFHIVSDWPCFAILNLADCEGFRFDSAWIGKRLGITQAEAQLALDRLERVGLLERKGGRLVLDKGYVLSPEGIPSEAIRNYHRQILKKAGETLDLHPVGEREFAGIGFAVHPRHLAAIKKEIAQFQDQIIAKYSTGRRTEVYHLETALFRLTEPVETGKGN